jgi:hypothetical protein
MPIFGSNILAGASGQAVGGVDVGTYTGKSLIFNKATSHRLSKTWSSTETDLDKFTFSVWIKRTSTDSGSTQYWMFGAGSPGESNIRIQADKITVHLTGSNYDFTGTRLLRDTSAWYHLVFRYDSDEGSAGDRFRCYINGELETWASSSTIPSGQDNEFLDSGVPMEIGNDASGTHDFDGYMAALNVIDGASLAPTSFGETSSDTGAWIIKDYSGSHGNNGFYFDFSDADGGTVTDNSANSNTFTANNYSSDVDASYTSDTPIDNFSILNFVDKHSNTTISEGGLKANGTASSWYGVTGTTAVSSGKYYWEVDITAIGSYIQIGICDSSHAGVWSDSLETYTSAWGYYSHNGNKLHNSASSSYGATYTTGDVIGVGLDMDAGRVYFYKDGAIQNSGTEAFSSITGHIRPIVQLYGSATVTMDFNPTCPTGYLPLSSTNLPEIEIGQEADDLAHDFFNTVIYTGNGSSGLSVTGMGFSPDLLWTMPRSNGDNGVAWDSVRGTTRRLKLNSTDTEDTDGTAQITFESDGFDLDTTDANFNGNTNTYVAWGWLAGTAFSNDASATSIGTIDSSGQANDDSGFSIVSFTGTGSAGTIKHGLSKAPDLIIVKARDLSSQEWNVYHSSNTSAPETDYLWLNSTNATSDASDKWNDTAPTTSVFSVGDAANINSSTKNYIAYCWHSVEGFSKFGSYAGNSSADGTFVYTGFPVAWLMVKKSDASGTGWGIFDNKRDTYNEIGDELFTDNTDSEGTGDRDFDFLSNGFKCRRSSSYFNNSGNTFIFIAFSAGTGFKYANAKT